MDQFAQLLDRLTLTPSLNGKLRLIVDYFQHTPDPDRGYALAAITRDLNIPNIKSGMLRGLMAERMDEELFRLSYDYVGDLAETISLVWDADQQFLNKNVSSVETSSLRRNSPPGLAEIIDTLNRLGKAQALSQLSDWCDQLNVSGRYALLKLVTGGMRIGVSARLAKVALAQFGERHQRGSLAEIEELWHGLELPYEDLFAWLSGKGEKPTHRSAAPFRPVMLANALSTTDREKLDPELYAAEWKWDGIRVQISSDGGIKRIYSRTGDDIGSAFPDILDAFDFEGTVDGELLIGRLDNNGNVAIGSFSDLQKRLNRKKVSNKMMADYPAFVRLYDCLFLGEFDQRKQSFKDRRNHLTDLLTRLDPGRFDLSGTMSFSTWDELESMRENPPHPVIEGVMLKRWDSIYEPGRPKGPWFKWKKDPMLIDAVLMYAQRGHGRRSSFYSDYTFGVWAENGELVPVGKAYFGFTDEELKQLDKFVRDNTIERFGPVRSVTARPDFGLVLEVAFEGLNRSSRHKSGVAMRFPRISRLRWDKPPGESDTLESVLKLLSD